MQVTKPINQLSINENLIKPLIYKKRKEMIIYEFNQGLSRFVERFYNCTKDDLVKIQNKNLLYMNSLNLMILDTSREHCPDDTFSGKLYEHDFRLMNLKEIISFIFMKNNPIIKDGLVINKVDDGFKKYSYITTRSHSLGYIDIKSNFFIENGTSISDKYCLNLPVIDFKSYKNKKWELFLSNGFVPDKLSEEDKKLFLEYKDLYDKKKLIFTGEDLKIDESYEKDILDGKIKSLLYMDFEETYVKEKVLNETVNFDGEIRECIMSELLNCDYNRAEIEPYTEKILEDANDGHWDLWEDIEDNRFKITINTKLMARNPIADIREDGIVGIDFGTKSTIVVYQNGDENTLPMRIGSGKYKKDLKKEDFENPTVMEFRNLESFLSDYNRKNARPNTRWEDITVSHMAAEQLKSGTDSSKYYSFFSDLKQWCGDRTSQIRLRDNNGYEHLLSSFVDIEEDDFNPLELYAYYLGLFINNMYNGIYLNYILSFPVTYEKDIREKIIYSFKKGIKKSFPKTVLDDSDSMSKFRIVQGASEPAAYAICALQEYGFEPQEDEKIFYGIFDFGGGTADFDFGIFRLPEGKEMRRYDYVIEHFGAEGDRYLGGENLLELLAFNVFKKNKEKLLKSDISFYRPPECKEFAGHEMLLSNSQEARLNSKQLVEKLRGLWQNDNEEDIKAIEEGKIKVLLFTKTGQIEANFELDVDKDEILEILEKRIEKGINQFFEALKLTFHEKNDNQTGNVEQINIFLAGNSSKSPIVKKLFDNHIRQRSDLIKQENNIEDEEYEIYKLFPPLGTEEAKEIQSQKGIDIDDDITNPRPTGKTGVAYGLIEGRSGSRIKVISEIKSTDEVKFKYYIGENRRKKFHCIIDRNIEYGKWTEFIDASEDDFEFYYTSLPEVTTNNLNIGEDSIRKKVCRIDVVDEDANVYLRAVRPTVIEYVVSKDIENQQYLGNVVSIELG